MSELVAPSVEPLEAFLARHLPGSSLAIRRVRDQVIEFAMSPTARSLHLRGPIGAGKSTLARLVALARRVAPLAKEEAETLLGDAKFTPEAQLDPRTIAPFYTELSLTGLVESLAESQLFGTKKGAYTGAPESPGVFERASKSLNGDASVGAAMTGGVVFLDEVGDLPPALQAKLLPVFSGGTFYRLGSEGRTGAELTFAGVVITASWRELSGLVRPDLVSRICGSTITLPGIDDRSEDFLLIVRSIETALFNQFRAEVERLRVAEPKLAKGYWEARIKALAPLSDDLVDELAKVQWANHGNFRGLRMAIERMAIGRHSLDTVIQELPLTMNAPADIAQDDLLDVLFDEDAAGRTLGAHVRDIELAARRRLYATLFAEPVTLGRLAERIGVDRTALKTQLRQLVRERRGSPGDRE